MDSDLSHRRRNENGSDEARCGGERDRTPKPESDDVLQRVLERGCGPERGRESRSEGLGFQVRLRSDKGRAAHP